MVEVRIDSEVLVTIRTRVSALPDHEICGLLFGTNDRIVEARAAANVATNPAQTFEIDPQALIDALRAERAGGARVIGCYHSHPSGDATPSARDAAAAEPGRLWLIVANDQARLWRAKPGGFDEVWLVGD